MVRLILAVVASFVVLEPGFTRQDPGPDNDPGFSVLVFSKTTGYRHDSIADGIAVIEQLGADHNFSVVATEDDAQFTDDNLANYSAVLFLNTTGTVLDDTEK